MCSMNLKFKVCLLELFFNIQTGVFTVDCENEWNSIKNGEVCKADQRQLLAAGPVFPPEGDNGQDNIYDADDESRAAPPQKHSYENHDDGPAGWFGQAMFFSYQNEKNQKQDAQYRLKPRQEKQTSGIIKNSEKNSTCDRHPEVGLK